MVTHSTSSRQEVLDDLHKIEYSEIIHSQQSHEESTNSEAKKCHHPCMYIIHDRKF